MFPDNTLTPVAMPSPFLRAGSEALLSRTFDYEDGPIAEQDPSRGLAFQQWRAYVRDFNVILEADNRPPSVLLPSPFNQITDISIAFSQNADLHYVWVDNGVARFRWFDTVANAFATMTLPAGTRTPKCTLDDKRATQSGRNDIILSYIKSDNRLYFRMQRERFQTEHMLSVGPFISIERMYMNNGHRLQWLLTKGSL